MEIARTFDLLAKLRDESTRTDILNAKVNEQWQHYSAGEFISHAHDVSYALLHLGLKPGDKASILASNMPEWNFADYGCQMAGIISVPIYPTISASDLAFILNHSEAKI